MYGIELSVPFLAAAGTAALLFGLSKGGLANAGVLAMPLMALVMTPVKAAAILLPILVVSDVFGVWAYRREFSRRNLLIILPSAVVGVGIGWATASQVSAGAVTLLLGLLGIAYCINAYWPRRSAPAVRPADVPRGVFWGTVMGFTSFVAHTGGPPLQVYLAPQRLSPPVFAGTLAIVFGVINALKLLPYWALGQFTQQNLRSSIVLMPIALLGTFLGVKLVRVLPRVTYYKVIDALLFVVSLWVLKVALYDCG